MSPKGLGGSSPFTSAIYKNKVDKSQSFFYIIGQHDDILNIVLYRDRSLYLVLAEERSLGRT